MKRSLMVFAAISSFVLPATAPVAALAQDSGNGARNDQPQPPRRERSRPTPNHQDADRGGGSDNGGRSWTPPALDDSARPDRGGNRGQGGGDRGGSRPDRPQAPSQPTPQPQPDRSGGNDGRDRGGRPDRGGDNNGGWNGGNQGRPGQDRPGQDRPGQHGNGGWNGGSGPGRPDRPSEGRPGNNGGWNGNGRPGNDWNNGGDRNRDRDRQRNDYRNRFDSSRWQQSWNRNHRPDWWRSDRRFNGWSGARIGFYFAPGYGYYSVPRSYYGRTYYEGDYLPSVFWRYSVNDYRTYGLGYPPEGTRWVYVDNSIYLIDQYDGYIIDVIRNAWRW